MVVLGSFKMCVLSDALSVSERLMDRTKLCLRAIFVADALKEALAVRRQAEPRQQRQPAIKVNNGFQEKSIDRIERPSMDIGLLRIKGYIQEMGKPFFNSVHHLSPRRRYSKGDRKRRGEQKEENNLS